MKQFNEQIRCHTARRTCRRFLQNIEHVTRFIQHAAGGLRIDDVTPRAFVLHELSNLRFIFFKREVFLTPYSLGILLIYKQCASSCPTNYAVSTVQLMTQVMCDKPIPLAARSKVWVNDFWLAGIAGSNPTGDMGVCLL